MFVKVKVEEANEVLKIYKSVLGMEYCPWSENYPTEQEIAFDLSRDALFCIKDDEGKIIGVISIDEDEQVEALSCWSKEIKPVGELSRLGVLPEYQNKGIARKLLLGGMDELKRRGYKGVHFLVAKDNVKAIRSYDKLQFQVVGECYMYEHDYLCYEKCFLV